VPATVTLSAAGLASAGEGVAAAALEAAAGGACRWRVKLPPGGRCGGVRGGRSVGGAGGVQMKKGGDGSGRSCLSLDSDLQLCAAQPPSDRGGVGGAPCKVRGTVICASAAEAVRLVLSSSAASGDTSPHSSSSDEGVVEESEVAPVPSRRKWFLQQHVEGRVAGARAGGGHVYEVHASVLAIGALRVELHRNVRGLDEAVLQSISSSSAPTAFSASGRQSSAAAVAVAAAAARVAVAATLRDTFVAAAKHRRCFLPFTNCFEVFAARVLVVRDDDASWRAWLLRLDDAFSENLTGGETAASLDALAAHAVIAAAAAFSFHSAGSSSVGVAEKEGGEPAFELIYDSRSSEGPPCTTE